MAVIVTGATGQFGRAATKYLLEKLSPKDLILVTRKPEQLEDLTKLGASVRYGDFDKPESLKSALAGGEKMLLISATRVGFRIPQHKAAIDAAKAAGVRHVVYTSFARAKPSSVALVNKDHSGTESLLRESGLKWTFLQDGWYADAIATAIAPRVLAQGQWITSSGDGRCAPVARDDCAACAAAVLTGQGHENKAYPITGAGLFTIDQIAALVTELGGGRKVEVVQVTDDDMYAMFDSLGIPRAPVDDQVVNDIPWCSDDMVSFERCIREGDLNIVTGDLQRLLGRPPKTLRSVLEAHLPALHAAARA